MPNKKNNSKTAEAIRHDEATRKSIPTAEYQSVMRETEVGDQESGIGGQWGRTSYPVSSIESR